MIARKAGKEDAARIAQIERAVFSDAWSEQGIRETPCFDFVRRNAVLSLTALDAFLTEEYGTVHLRSGGPGGTGSQALGSGSLGASSGRLTGSGRLHDPVPARSSTGTARAAYDAISMVLDAPSMRTGRSVASAFSAMTPAASRIRGSGPSVNTIVRGFALSVAIRFSNIVPITSLELFSHIIHQPLYKAQGLRAKVSKKIS